MKLFRATPLLVGITLATGRAGLVKNVERQHFTRRSARLTHGKSAVKSGDDTRLRIAESMRFHRERYEKLTRSLHGRCHLAAAVLSCLISIMLAWRAASGEHISPERWLWGGLSGWFFVVMARLALFTCLAAPRFIYHEQGKLCLSGLGTLRPEQILQWSIEREAMSHACEKPGVRVRLCCHWLGWERHWTMVMEEGPETERLQRLLEAAAPGTADPAARRMHRTIPIEAGMLSQ